MRVFLSFSSCREKTSSQSQFFRPYDALKPDMSLHFSALSIISEPPHVLAAVVGVAQPFNAELRICLWSVVLQFLRCKASNLLEYKLMCETSWLHIHSFYSAACVTWSRSKISPPELPGLKGLHYLTTLAALFKCTMSDLHRHGLYGRKKTTLLHYSTCVSLVETAGKIYKQASEFMFTLQRKHPINLSGTHKWALKKVKKSD